MKRLFGGLCLLTFTSGCAQQETIFYRYRDHNQFRVKAVDVCHGDFEMLERQRFGPYERATLECLP